MEILMTQFEIFPSLTTHLMLLYRHHAFQRTDCLPLPLLFVFFPALIFIRLLQFGKISFCLTFKRVLLSVIVPRPVPTHPIFRQAHSSDHCSCSDHNKFSHTTTAGPSSACQNFMFPRPAHWNPGWADITASSSTRESWLVFCNACNAGHVGIDLCCF